MAKLHKVAAARWQGNVKDGSGRVSTGSGVVTDLPYNLKARIGEEADTSNPEELVAAAVASCYSMAVSKVLNDRGKEVSSIEAKASLSIDTSSGVPRVAAMKLEVQGEVAGVDRDGLEDAARETLKICPMVLLVEPGLIEGISLEVRG